MNRIEQADYSAVVNICVESVRDQYRMGGLNMPLYTLHIVQIVLDRLERDGFICPLNK